MSPETTPPEPPQGPRRDNPWRQVGVALGLIFTIPAGVLVGALLGLWLDGQFGTKPWLTMLLTGIGFGASLREVLRELRRMDRP